MRAAPASADPLSGLLVQLHGEPLRVSSILITVFGDAIRPRGGAVGAATLTRIAGAMGIEAGAVRTALSRLAAEGWLARERVGRAAFYRLAPEGAHAFDAATRRIYAAGPPAWDGRWTVVALPPGAGEARKTLIERGFGTLAPALLVHPGAAAVDLPGATVFSGAELTAGDIEEAWPLGPVRAAYDEVAAALAAAGPVEAPEAALVTRLLLLHVWRRAVLRDPGLPPVLLPADWPVEGLRQALAALYRDLLPPSEHWLDLHGAGPDGPLPPASAALYARFA